MPRGPRSWFVRAIAISPSRAKVPVRGHMPHFFSRHSRSAATAPLGRSLEAARRIRRLLDPAQVLEACVAEVVEDFRSTEAEVWTVSGNEPPKRMAWVRNAVAPPSGTDPPDAISRAIRRGLVSHHGGWTASPIEGSRMGIMGALGVAGHLDEEQTRSLCWTAQQAGFALEAAVLYTEATNALERAETILEGVRDGVVVTDSAGQVTQWNASAELLSGCPRDQAIGRTCHEALGLHAGDEPLDCSKGCALLAMGEDSREVWRTRIDGRRQPLLVSVGSVKDVNGELTEAVHSIRDLTILKQADEAKTMFLATASHELKTPLTVILGFAQSLRIGTVDDSMRDVALQAIERRAVELSRIVDRLLMTGRIDSGRVDVRVRMIEPGPIIIERATSLSQVIGRPIKVMIADALPSVHADPDALITCVDHLLDNAVKYSPEGDIKVSCTASEGAVAIEVSDEGIGMDSQQCEGCFEKFWQAESSDHRRFGGTGIGLYIVKSLSTAMGAQLSVRSELGRGCTFTLLLRSAGSGPLGSGEVEIATRARVGGYGQRSMIQEFMQQIGIQHHLGEEIER